MTTAALKGLSGRKLRAFLTAFAIVLGVAMVSGAFVLTDTMKKAADSLTAASYEGIDAVVTGKAAFDSDADWQRTPPVSDRLVARVQGVPEVDAAVGTVMDQAKLVNAKGKVIGQPPNFAVGIDAGDRGAQRLNPLDLSSGRWPIRTGEVVIDAGTAKRQHLSIGDTIGVVPRGRKLQFRIVGLVSWGDVQSLGTATVAGFDLSTAQRLFGKPHQVDQILTYGRPGVSAPEVRRAIGAMLPQNTQVQTAKQADPFDFAGLQEFVKIIKIFLLGFGGVALFVGAFIIFNTFSITVAQRAREFALLRTIGASRRQVLGSVVVEAVVIGLAATAVGIGLGIGLAKGLNALMQAIQLDLPQAGTVFELRTVLVSLIVGVVVTVLAALVPAVRATRVAPVSILREGASVPRTRFGAFGPYLAAGATALGGAFVAYGMFADGIDGFVRVLAIGGGAVTLFLGVALLSPRLVRPLAHVLGWPAARLAGGAGRLARENSVRNPSRTAVTASALMIGLTLVTFVTVLGRGMRDTWGSTIDKQLSADYVLTTDSGWDSFSPGSATALVGRPGVEAVSAVRSGQALVDKSQVSVSGLDTATIDRFYRFHWKSGSNAVLRTLGRNGAIVDDDFAKHHHVAVGDRFRITTPERTSVTLVVRGISRPAGVDSLLGEVAVSTAAFDSTYPRARNAMAFVDTNDQASRPALERTLEPYADVKLQTQPEFVDNQNRWIGQMLALFYVLLGLSLIVSFFGIVNTLVLSTFERTRELGMLRAVGMTRRQVRRMVRHESVITALIGAALGIALGIGLAALVTARLSEFSQSEGGDGMAFSVPVGPLAVFAVVAVIAGILAAILPARRASRLNILEALQYE
jgi:putative ABC transport system permease protein